MDGRSLRPKRGPALEEANPEAGASGWQKLEGQMSKLLPYHSQPGLDCLSLEQVPAGLGGASSGPVPSPKCSCLVCVP